MKKILEFWEEANGQLSNLRLHNTMIVSTVCGCIIFMAIKGFDVQSTLIAILAMALGAKWASKYAEEKPKAENDSNTPVQQ